MENRQLSTVTGPTIGFILYIYHPFWQLSPILTRAIMDLDRFDGRILLELQRDGRLPVVELAELIGLSATPCARRIKALESAGIIEGYAAILNPGRVGLAIQALVHVKLTEHTDETVARFEREIALLDEVTNCFATTGSYDFILQVFGKDLESLSSVILKKLL